MKNLLKAKARPVKGNSLTRYSVETVYKGLEVNGIIEVYEYRDDRGATKHEVNVELVHVFDGDKFLDLYNLPSRLSFDLEHALLEQLEKDHEKNYSDNL